MGDIIPTVNQENEEEARNHVSIELGNYFEMGNDDELFISMEKMLKLSSPQSSEKYCIYRVFPSLRRVKSEAYTPRVVSIGPFHRSEARLQAMEVYKLRHLKAFIPRTGKSLQDFLELVRGLEQDARNCYAETLDDLKSDEFVKMILMDGCFIVELLLSLNERHLSLSSWQMVSDVMDDMLLLENQLPFFVLVRFYDLVHDKKYSSLVMLVHKSFYHIGRIINELPDGFSEREIKHFVDFMHHCYYVSSFQNAQNTESSEAAASSSPSQRGQVLLPAMATSNSSPVPSVVQTWVEQLETILDQLFAACRYKGPYIRPPTATELHQAGIKFKKGTGTSLFVIKFTNGVLEIPQLIVHDTTDTLFRNLIAFEQYCRGKGKCIFAHYFALLDGLINTSEDVDLLLHDEVITNMLSSSEELSTLINDICKHVSLDASDFYYSDICQALNAYCRVPRHKWKATLRRKYFNSPWAIISVITALILLLLTFIQSVCSIISVS